MNQFLKRILLAWLIIFSISCSNQSGNQAKESATEIKTKASQDFSSWNGNFFSFGSDGNGIRLEGKDNTLKAFDSADGSPLEVEIMDGKILIEGAEAFVSNDTLHLVLNGSGGSHETIYVRVLNDMN